MILCIQNQLTMAEDLDSYTLENSEMILRKYRVYWQQPNDILKRPK